MLVATVVVSLLLAAVVLGSGASKLAGASVQRTAMESVRFPVERMWVLGALEVLGGIGLVVGLWWAPIGVAAGIGVALYFLGAVIAHLRVGDRAFAPALLFMLLAVAAVVLRLLTA